MISCHPDPFAAFVRDLQLPGCEVHLYKGANAFGMTLTPVSKPPVWWETENVYFLAGVRPGLKKRAADADVLKRGMFTLDFDIRKEMEKEGIAVDGQEDIVTVAEAILEALEPRPMFGKMRYAVLSGNGLHVHYFGPPCDVVKEEWGAGMKDLFDEVETLTPVPPDHGVGNAGRIMRMPGSWNVKGGGKKPVTFLVWNRDATLPPLSCIQERGRVAIARRNERVAAEQKQFEATHPDGSSDVITMINAIPIEQIVTQLPLGCKVSQVKRGGGLRFADAQGTERGFFKHSKFNVIVHEGTSLFIPPNGVGYNCLGLVKVVLGLRTHEAIRWFEERSPEIADTAKQERVAWARRCADQEAKAFLSPVSHVR